jgi:hypothetical protein
MVLLTRLARALAAIEGEGEIEPPYRRSEPNGDVGGSCSSDPGVSLATRGASFPRQRRPVLATDAMPDLVASRSQRG